MDFTFSEDQLLFQDSVRDFLEAAFEQAGLNWQDYVEFDERYLRPTEVDHLEGDAAKAKDKLGWTAATDFNALVTMMAEADHELARRERTLVDAGHGEGPTALHG